MHAVQRGLQVYQEVCHACHGLSRIAFRNLTAIGLSEDQAKAVAEGYQIEDGPNEDGDMFERAGRLSDYFPDPFPNKNAARASNNLRRAPSTWLTSWSSVALSAPKIISTGCRQYCTAASNWRTRWR